MKSIFLCLISCFSLAVSVPNCYAQASTSLDMLNNAKQYDGKTVSYKGEVIGDVMIRGDHAWLHVNDGNIAIGVWASKQLVQDISFAGNYNKRGDTVEVSGTFHRSCLEHGGDLDIHAQAIRIVNSGAIVTQSVNKKKIYLGIISSMVVLLFYALRKYPQGRK